MLEQFKKRKILKNVDNLLPNMIHVGPIIQSQYNTSNSRARRTNKYRNIVLSSV
jgi:hypothetical protein